MSSRYAAEGLASARDDFVRRYPAYAATAAVDELRAADYARLDRLGQTYLDYTGGGLYAESQVRRHHELLSARVLGNPHSQSPTSLASAELAAEARDAVRRFFNAPEDEFEIVFTANASGALKLVGEAYPFAPGGVFLLSYDNHNSVNGIREFACHARRRGHLHPGARAGPAARRGAGPHGAARRGEATGGTARRRSSSRIRRSPTSAAPSIRSSGSPRRTSSAGTSCSTAPPSRRPIPWTPRRSAPTSSRSPSTSSSATRPAAAA